MFGSTFVFTVPNEECISICYVRRNIPSFAQLRLLNANNLKKIVSEAFNVVQLKNSPVEPKVNQIPAQKC